VDPVWIEVGASIGGSLFVCGATWGMVKAETKALTAQMHEVKEELRHHVQSVHPPKEEKVQELEVELARITAVDAEERRRR